MENISLKSIKWESIRSIFHSITASEKISRAEISAATGLSLMTVGKVADALLDLHVITQAKESRGTAGRRAGLLSVAPENYAVILDLCSCNFRLTVINMRLEVLDKYHYTFNDRLCYSENLTVFLEDVRAHLADGFSAASCIGCGVSVPGTYSAEKDCVIGARVPELTDVPLAQTIRSILTPPRLYIEAAHNAAATSNITRIPNNRDMVILYWFIAEENICGTVIYHGEILRGAHNAAGNFANLRVSRGRTLHSALKAAETPEEIALELARAIRNVITVIDPDTIILECELYKKSEEFVELVRSTLTEQFALPAETLPQIVSAGCKYRHSHRGLTMTLREMWLSELILGDE